MALKSSREGLRKELVDYLGNLIVDDNLRNEIIKVVDDNFVTSESLNETVNNLTMQITTESGERIDADDTLQNNITAEATAREGADTTLQNNINAETTARQEAISGLQELIGNSGLQMDLLWTNASSSSNFEPQTISLDLSSYKAILIVSNFANDKSTTRANSFIKIGEVGQCAVAYQKDQIFFRNYTVNETGVIISNGLGSEATEPRADWSVPLKIYGVK